MPKQKTHRGLAKRVKRTGKGGLKRFRAFTSHRFHGKTKKQRRKARANYREYGISFYCLFTTNQNGTRMGAVWWWEEVDSNYRSQ